MRELIDKQNQEHYEIRYLTRYEYDLDVVDNLNALRVRPAVNARQQLEEFAVRLSPDARMYRHDDYFGTEVIEFEITRPHRELTIDVRARVSTNGQLQPDGTSWDGLGEQNYREAGGEFLVQTEDAPAHPVLIDLRQQVASAATPLDAVMMVSELIADRFAYGKGATYVNSPITDALDAGIGVCQDFTHIGLNLLRHHGIAGRYVSGYLFSTADSGEPDPDELSESVEVETHAWIEALLPGDGGGEPQWVSIDPTNRGLAGSRHVKIGHGRHYADVPPVKGVYRGPATSKLDTSVRMTRVAGPDAAAMARN